MGNKGGREMVQLDQAPQIEENQLPQNTLDHSEHSSVSSQPVIERRAPLPPHKHETTLEKPIVKPKSRQVDSDQLIITRVQRNEPKIRQEAPIVIDLDTYQSVHKRPSQNNANARTIDELEAQRSSMPMKKATKERYSKNQPDCTLEQLDDMGDEEPNYTEWTTGRTEPLKNGNENYMKQYGKPKRTRVSRMG